MIKRPGSQNPKVEEFIVAPSVTKGKILIFMCYCHCLRMNSNNCSFSSSNSFLFQVIVYEINSPFKGKKIVMKINITI